MDDNDELLNRSSASKSRGKTRRVKKVSKAPTRNSNKYRANIRAARQQATRRGIKSDDFMQPTMAVLRKKQKNLKEKILKEQKDTIDRLKFANSALRKLVTLYIEMEELTDANEYLIKIISIFIDILEQIEPIKNTLHLSKYPELEEKFEDDNEDFDNILDRIEQLIRYNNMVVIKDKKIKVALKIEPIIRNAIKKVPMPNGDPTGLNMNNE